MFILPRYFPVVWKNIKIGRFYSTAVEVQDSKPASKLNRAYSVSFCMRIFKFSLKKIIQYMQVKQTRQRIT